jgi:hypothetical protein
VPAAFIPFPDDAVNLVHEPLVKNNGFQICQQRRHFAERYRRPTLIPNTVLFYRNLNQSRQDVKSFTRKIDRKSEQIIFFWIFGFLIHTVLLDITHHHSHHHSSLITHHIRIATKVATCKVTERDRDAHPHSHRHRKEP